jgi:hypothetical protein
LILFKKYCGEANLKPFVRLNGTSDISWEKYSIFTSHLDIQFYDYTKVHNRKITNLTNYHLTYSRSEESTDKDLTKALDNGMNVAVVFNKSLPETYRISTYDIPVINGDLNDLRAKDPKRVVVGLVAKGDAKTDKSGFVVYS